MRQSTSYHIQEPDRFKKKLLNWSMSYYEVAWMDSNDYEDHYSSYDAILAVDALTSIQTDAKEAFDQLKEYQLTTQDWLFGYLSYDLKNDVEKLSSNNFDGLQFPDLVFFQPKKLIFLKDDVVTFSYLNMVSDELDEDYNLILNTSEESHQQSHQQPIKIKMRVHKEAYFEKINHIMEHLHRGDIYEMNFCQEFYAEDTYINPLETYIKLDEISKPPFATFLKLEDKYLLSASPERYLKRTGTKVISQPIKGTAKRSKNPEKDERLKQQLQADEKERSENIMIVDLVRNDLAKTSVKGSVKVEELCQVYSFPQVHQMISTVTSQVMEDTPSVDMLKSTFPMGSMTGAPKLSAMKLIETYEETKRGLYSGAVGYISPSGDFDFNVVIRSILYNETKKYVSYSVGGAITAQSDPLKEYEECLLKAKAMRKVLED